MIFVDIFPIVTGIVSGGVGLGFGYEHDIGKYFGTGGEIIFVSDFDDMISYNIIANGIFYPIRTRIGNLFIDEGLSYRRRKSNYDGSNDDIICLMGLTNIGWKIILFNSFVLIPEFGIKYDIVTFYGDEAYKFGLNIKTKIGWMF